ncbi:MAG: two-component system response regulator NarL [Pseudomonadales bacterium]|nr:two-component system response regulator NarL [Pseudomonadales bacterium]MCP5213974.1 two-component system response regulator NarL [Pseudomonadales bacterium]MCP5302818.1 two-component system response regulator NarL [Pseudomonadales bacterium]
MTDKARILLVDDHPLLRTGVLQLIALEDDLEAVGEASSGEEAITQAASLDPDLILLDLNMKGMNGIDTLIALRKAEVTSRIVMFTVSDNQEDVVAALQAGADGYLLKDMEPDDLIRKIRLAANGQLVLSEELTELLALAIQSKSRKDTKVDIKSMTKRERQILKLLAAGMTNKHIARKLDITEGTVKVHIKHLFKKLNLKSRVEAAIWAMEHKI